MATETPEAPETRSHWHRYRVLYAVIAVCIAPVLASYFTYYVLPPGGRTNFGTLIEPQRPVPGLNLRTLDGRPFQLKSLAGKWVLLTVDQGECDKACAGKLFAMRQQRLMTGKDSERIERVWLIDDAAPLSTMLMREHEGVHFLRADSAELHAWLPAGDAAGRIEDYIYVVDPFGNLMLRWPGQGEPKAIKRDLARLLRASSQWIYVNKPD